MPTPDLREYGVLIKNIGTKKKVVHIFEKRDSFPVVLLEEYDLVEVRKDKGSWTAVHIQRPKDDRKSSDCVVIVNKTEFLVSAIRAKQAQIERHHKEIEKLVAQLRKYAISDDPSFK